MAVPKLIADFESQITSAISIGSTSFTILSVTDDDGNTIPDGKYYYTVDSGSSNKEYLVGTLTGATKTVSSVKNVDRQGIETSGAVREHRVGANIKLTDFATYKNYMDEVSIAGASNATTSLQGLVELATTAEIDAGTATGGTGATLSVTPDALAASIYGTRLPSESEKSFLTQISTSFPGVISPYAGRTAPTGWLLCDGSAVSRTTYSSLFSVISPSQTFTVTIASPGVFTATAHGLVAGEKIHFTTTGGLPSGLSTNTDYYVISSGLATDTFKVALSPGGAAVNTTGSQSGTHTLYKSVFGKGDGSTTFNVPDLRAKTLVGLASSAPTQTLTFESNEVSTGSDTVTILDTIFPSQGQKIQLTTTGTLPTGLSTSTDYYIIRASSTTIKFATSQANANAGTAIDITGAGSGIHTITFTNKAHTVLGRQGGEETHGTSIAEMPAHTHTQSYANAASGGSYTVGSVSGTTNTGSAGGDGPHNNMQPFAVINYIIKY